MRNCPLISDDDFPDVSLFIGVGCAYIYILFGVRATASDILGRENIFNADLHDALVKLMHREKPVVKWTANENDDDPVATEVISFGFAARNLICVSLNIHFDQTKHSFLFRYACFTAQQNNSLR